MHRLRPFILITGTLLSLLIVAAFVMSGWWFVIAEIETPFGWILLRRWSLVVVLDDPQVDSIYNERIVDADGNLHLIGWSGLRHIPIPLYILFLTVAVPTLLVWRYWPKPVRPGHCRCGYDLMGNTSGVCPECGSP